MENSNGKCVLGPQYSRDEFKQLHFYCENCGKEMDTNEVRDCPALVNTPSTNTMEARVDEHFAFWEIDDAKKFIRTEISLALQKREEELVGKVQKLIESNDDGMWSGRETAETILNIIQQP